MAVHPAGGRGAVRRLRRHDGVFPADRETRSATRRSWPLCWTRSRSPIRIAFGRRSAWRRRTSACWRIACPSTIGKQASQNVIVRMSDAPKGIIRTEFHEIYAAQSGRYEAGIQYRDARQRHSGLCAAHQRHSAGRRMEGVRRRQRLEDPHGEETYSSRRATRSRSRSGPIAGTAARSISCN